MSTRHLHVCIPATVVVLVVLLVSNPGYAAATTQVEQGSSSSTLRQKVAQERPGFKDLTATLVVESKDDRVLEKIGERRIGEYGVNRAQIRLKAPDCTRIESAANGLRAVSITNHENSILRVKPIGYQKTKPLSDSARNRPLAMLLGLVTPNLWGQFAVSDAGAGGEGSTGCCMLDLSRADGSSKLYRITVEMKTLTLRECDVYGSAGDTPKLICRYLEPVQVNGLWVPAKLELRSGEDELAAVLKISDIAINTGLDDALFR